jgi:hypothetical protein
MGIAKAFHVLYAKQCMRMYSSSWKVFIALFDSGMCSALWCMTHYVYVSLIICSFLFI